MEASAGRATLLWTLLALEVWKQCFFGRTRRTEAAPVVATA